MPPTRLHRLKSQAGAALVLVLSTLVLLSIVALAYLASTSLERASSQSYSDGAKTRMLADIALEIVKGQIWAATTETNAGGATSWASQPGAIRTFTAGQTNPVNVYKLYSSDAMVVANSSFNATSDVPSNWATQTNDYVDLNRPINQVVIDSAGNRSTNVTYPIIDPTAIGTVVGLTNSAIPGGTTTGLPMPVRWFYVLQNGTITNSSIVSAAYNASNPIVGRIAFWTDDDTCKININTAGEGVFWDTPRVWSSGTSGTDVFDLNLARFQPAKGEFQRYPGHPMTVSLRTVFPELATAPGTDPTTSLDPLYALTPRVPLYFNAASSDFVGSKAGLQKPDAPIPLKQKRLYASMDEVMFQPLLSSASPPRRVENVSGTSTTFTPDLLNRRNFVLTSYNRAPELNLYGKPRISMWPLDADPAKHSPTDKWFAKCSTIAGNTYAVTRSDPTSATADFNSSNSRLFSYLKTMTGQTPPGFSNSFSSKYGSGGRDQILTLMMDYVRCVNLYDSSVQTGTRGTTPDNSGGTAGVGDWPYNDNAFAKGTPMVPSPGQTKSRTVEQQPGFGQVVPLRIGSYKGLGRFDTTLSEVAIQFFALANGTSAVLDPATGDPLYRAIIWLEPFNPMAGFLRMNPNYRHEASGLTSIQVNGNQIFTYDSATNYVYGKGGEAPHFGGHLSGVVNTLINWPQENFGLGLMKTIGNDGTSYTYPFGSSTFPLPSTSSNFTFSGNLTITIKGPTGNNALQTIGVSFPTVTVQKPDLNTQIPVGNPRWKTDRITGAGNTGLQYVRNEDVVISVEATERATDFRWLSLQTTLDTTFYQPHPLYYSTGPGQFKACGTRRSLLYIGGSNGNSTSGQIIPNEPPDNIILDRAIRPKISSHFTSGVKMQVGANSYPGDWDTGFGDIADGAYANKPDEGDFKVGHIPYFLGASAVHNLMGFQMFFMPNRQIPSAGMFGSLPSRGTESDGAWKTLLFNPNPAAGDNHQGFQSPPDYLFLDLFNMPIVEPYAISEPFSTAGKINMNYQIIPFTYISRTTALQAALAANRVTAIHNRFAPNFKFPPNNKSIRHTINATETLKQFDARFSNNSIFRSASEICSLDLYPNVSLANMPGGTAADPPSYSSNRNGIKNWWSKRLLTGDNLREQPYTTLYQNLTTQANTYTTHVFVQSLTQTPAGKLVVGGEWRGSFALERFLDPNNPALPDFADPNSPNAMRFYQFRVNNTKQFLP